MAQLQPETFSPAYCGVESQLVQVTRGAAPQLKAQCRRKGAGAVHGSGMAVAFLMRKGRNCPDLDAALFFDPDEIRGAHLLNKMKMLASPPTLNEVARLIAQIGGFLARNGDGDPGVKTIWKGLDQVHASAETLRALRDGLG